MRFLSVFRVCCLLGLAFSVTACSSTPDRYAFWRDTASAEGGQIDNAKPNLADIPASPNVDQARQDMQDMQKKLTADRDAAYTQAQNDKAVAEGKAPQTLAALSANTNSESLRSENLPPIGGKSVASANPISGPTANAPNNTLQAASADTAQPAMQNPNRPDPNQLANGATWPVYVPPSVQINPVVPNQPLRPYAALQPAPNYTYGRAGVQFRERVTEANPVAAAPGTAPAIVSAQLVNNQNVTVDFSALGAAAPASSRSLQKAGINGLLTGAPAIYFNHGSTRLSSNDRKTLAALAVSAKNGAQPVQVIGHASSRTATKSAARAKAINLQISAQRADNVIAELTKKGVPAKRIQATAVGDQDARSAPSEAAARRVDVLIGH